MDRSSLRRLVAHCLDEEGADLGRGLGLVLVGDVVMRRLNRTYRAKDRTTDVLSFGFDGAWDNDGEAMITGVKAPTAERVARALAEAHEVDDPDARLLGEVVISVPQCQRQATEQGVSVGAEFVRLVVHGVLHVLGYDHETPDDAARMRPRERRYREWAARHRIDVGMLALEGSV